MDTIRCDVDCLICKIRDHGIGFKTEELKIINDNKTSVNYKPEEVIVKQGTFITDIIILRKGYVKIIVENNVKDSIVRIAKGIDLVGLPALGELSSYPFSVIALTNVEICHIRTDIILDLAQQNYVLTKTIFNWYAKNYTDIYKRIAYINSRNNIGKLALAMNYLFSNFDKNEIFRIVSRKEISELATISLESVNKILTQFKHDNIIKLNKGSLEIIDIQKIHRLIKLG